MTTTHDLENSYDWQEAFKYANGFNIGEVAEIRNAIEGENDGDEWIIWGRLNNGRWFYLHAGCDYTGWDCQAGGDSVTAPSEEELIRMGMDFGSRQRFGIAQPSP
jgi:hypothetical protein